MAKQQRLWNSGRLLLRYSTCLYQKPQCCRDFVSLLWPRCHALRQGASGARASGVGSSFLGWAHGLVKECYSNLVALPRALGNDGARQRPIWTHCSCRSMGVGMTWQSSFLRIGQGCWKDVQRSPAVPRGTRFSVDGVTGRKAVPSGLIPDWGLFLHGNKPRQTSTCKHSGQCWSGWQQIQSTCYQLPADVVEAPAGISVQIASTLCANSASSRLSNGASQQFVAPRWGRVNLADFRLQLCSPANQMLTCSEPSWGCHSEDLAETNHGEAKLKVMMFLMAWLSMGVMGNSQQVCCMESGSSSSGFAPNMALELVEANRVRGWRQQNRLEDDGDFAFYFLDYDQAVNQAGRAVAHAWLEARHSALGSMLQQVESTIREVDAKAPAIHRPLQVRPKQRKRPLRLKENQTEAPAAVQRRVDALTQVWKQAGALKPSGNLSPEIMDSWVRSCERLSQKHVTQAEPITIANALSTFRELRESMAERNRTFPPQAIDIDFLLHERTTAPSRALNALKWLSRQGTLSWPLSHVSLPEKSTSRKKKGQAIAASPTMLATLEEHIERRWELNDDSWTCLLASWIIATGVIRHRHLERSTPRKLTMSFAHFRCSKGKQRRNRGGFDYAVPSTFLSGWNWAERWHKLWMELPSEVQGRSGICFSAAGQPESQRMAQDVFFGQLEDISLLTSYSWRRLMPTVAHTIHVAPEVANALGDWQDASKVDATSKMPLHYSSVRYVESLKSKARCLGALQSMQFESWEVIPEEAIAEAVEAGDKMVKQLLPRDGHIVWSVPVTTTEAAARFAAAQQLRVRSASLRARAARDAAAMPRTVANKQVSAFLRDSTLLCAAFQNGLCSKSQDQCLAHQCAVIFKSGRVCGGKHAANECRDKRFIAVPPTPMDPPATKKMPKPPATPPPAKRTTTEASLPEREQPSKAKRRERAAASSPAELPPQSGSQPVILPAADQALPVVEEDAELKFDRLATGRGKTAQCPTKIYSNAAGGAIWLGGLPTVDTAPHFPVISLQLTCFEESIAKRGGIVLPDAWHMVLAPTNTYKRVEQWQAAFPAIKATVQAGEEILVHCMAGRHRAAAVGVLLRAIFTGESIPQADSWISQRRNIELHRIAYDKGVGQWLKDTLQKSQVGVAWPKVTGFVATSRSNLHLRTSELIPLCAHKQSATKALERLTYPIQCTRVSEALAWNRPVCTVCLSRAPASWRVLLREA